MKQCIKDSRGVIRGDILHLVFIKYPTILKSLLIES